MTKDVPDGFEGRLDLLGRGEEQRLGSYRIPKRSRRKSGQTEGMLDYRIPARILFYIILVNDTWFPNSPDPLLAP